MPRVASLRPDRPGLPKPLDSLIRNRWTIWPGTAGRFQPERPDDLSRNEWTLSSGMGGRFHRNTQKQRRNPLSLPGVPREASDMLIRYACMQGIGVEQRDLSYYRGHGV